MKKNFKKILFVFFIFSFVSNLLGQDIHFSQFYNSPLALNPANTGNFSGEWRVMNHFRNQWTALPYPYRTLSIGADKKFYRYNDIIGAGAYFINDRSGAINLLLNKIYVSGAYKKFFRNYSLSSGLQIGFVSKQISFNNLTFPEQYDPSNGDFNLLMNNYEPNNNDKASYIDVNAGFIGSTSFRKTKLETGIAFYHINSPRESFVGSGIRLPVRFVYHGKANIPLKGIFFMRPQFLYMQHKKANSLIAGSDIGIKIPYYFYKMNAVYTGCYVRSGLSRNTDAVILTCGIEWFRFALGLSYDFNMTIIKPAANKRGSFEISLIYTSFNTVPPKITIPCNLY